MLLVEVDQDLGVAIGGEAVAPTLELALQLSVVVDLAVLDHDAGAVLVGNRLVAVVEVDDRESAGGKSNRALVKYSLVIGAAVDEATVHPPHDIQIGGTLSLGGDEAADTAHGRQSRSGGGWTA